jgi:hypothetical protein
MQWQELVVLLKTLANQLVEIFYLEVGDDGQRQIPIQFPVRGAPEDVENFIETILTECAEWKLGGLFEEFSMRRVGSNDLINSAVETIAMLEDVEELIEWDDIEIKYIFNQFLRALKHLEQSIDREITAKRVSYVYVHRDPSGNIFYVGKGTRQRAWSKNRHILWRRYVEERLGGRYEVEIIKDKLSEDEAELMEAELMEKYGDRLVNWGNPARFTKNDLPELERYQTLRNANQRFVAETRPLETIDIQEAVRRYREALSRMREYESLHPRYGHGLVAELAADFLLCGDLTILDRLTLCLMKIGRGPEAITEAEKYFKDFPGARERAAGKTIIKRIAKLETALSKKL